MYGSLPDLLISLLRHILTFLGGIIVARGWVDAETATQLVGALITLVGILFSAFFHAASNGTVPTMSVTPNMGNMIENKTTTIKTESIIPQKVIPS